MAYTERSDLNYLGTLFNIGANQTPLLNMMGGLNGGKTTRSFNFPVAQPWALRAGDQSTAVKSEDTSISDVTNITYTRGQDYNTCQIMKYPYAVSFAKETTYGEIGGISVQGVQPVTSELAFQKAAALKQLAVDLEFSFFQGSYVAQSAGDTVAKTQGLENAIATNTVAGSAGDLTKALIDELLIEMAGNGAEFNNIVMFVNAFQKSMLSNVYGYAPESRTIGGVAVDTVLTDFGQFGISYAPQMPTDELYVVDMSVMSPMFCPHNGKVIEVVDTAISTASKGGFVYTQAGLDFGPEEFHGSLTGLSTS